MKRLMEEIFLDTSILDNFEVAELYTCINKQYIYEFLGDRYEAYNSCRLGTTLRSFDTKNKTGKVYIINGKAKTDDELLTRAKVNEIPYLKIPKKKIQNNEEIFPICETITRDTYLFLHKKIVNLCKEHNLLVNKMVLTQCLDAYKLINSYGVKGYGYRTIFCMEIQLQNLNGKRKTYYKIMNQLLLENILQNMSEIHMGITMNRSMQLRHVVNKIYLSEHAVSEIVYLLLFFLTDTAMKQGESFISRNINELDDVLTISSLISIEENSRLNLTVGGNIDGEGTERVSRYIFENGKYVQPISSYGNGMGIKTTASSYRFDYRILPYTKATKIMVKNGDLLQKELLDMCNDVVIVENLQGMYESFDKMTFDFNAVVEADILHEGIYLGRKSVRLSSNILEILSCVSAISRETKYECDGCLKVPAFICDMEWII